MSQEYRATGNEFSLQAENTVPVLSILSEDCPTEVATDVVSVVEPEAGRCSGLQEILAVALPLCVQENAEVGLHPSSSEVEHEADLLSCSRLEDESVPPSNPQDSSSCCSTFEGDSIDSAGETAQSEPEDDILPVSPSDVEALKYYREVSYSMTKAKVETIDPLQQNFTRASTPENWRECVGPEGNLYFVHEELPFVTLSNILQEVQCRRVNSAVARLHTRLLGANLPEDVEVVVVCTYLRGVKPVIGYYLVVWATRTVTWFESVHHNMVTRAERQPVSLPHLRLALTSQFYNHVEIFCSHRPLPKATFKELRDAYRSGVVDGITSMDSMFTYDTETTLKIVKILKSFDDEDDMSGDATWSAARLLKTLYSDRYLAFYGEVGARCARNDAALEVGEYHKLRPFLFLLISLPCFCLPSVYLKELELLFKDKTVHYHAWGRFIGDATKDWADLTVPALVLLIADVGLLIIQAIENQGSTRSVGQITGYASAVLSLFVSVSCQVLTRRHRHMNMNTDALTALAYIVGTSLPCIAVAFSLPGALLLWSSIAFLASLMYTCLVRSSLATQITLGAVLGVLAVLFALLLFVQNGDKSPTKGFKLFFGECTKYLGSFKNLKLFQKTRRVEDVEEEVKDDGEKGEKDGKGSSKDARKDSGSSSSYSVGECDKASTMNTAGRRRGWKLWPWGSSTGLRRTQTKESDRTLV